jgi:CHAT domain-containing protein
MPAPVQTPDVGAALRQRLWEPLRELVGDATTVFVSPDGFLCELPLGILAEEDGSYLLEKHRFVYLTDATRLVHGDPPASQREGALLAVGDVNYFKAEAPPADLAMAHSTRSRISSSWEPLSATREEIQFLRGLHVQALEWEASFTQLEGKAATEEAVRRALEGQRYVHVATHGYFEPDGLPSLMANAEKADFGTEREVVGLLPGLLAGLVLAGVNAEPEPGRDDGYLSAEEIQYLDLSACDIAVLSACETALGSRRAGEGLMSLRRAFEVAGAKTVISSLWKVDDRATAALMKRFYENYWLAGMGKADALHDAKLRMLRQNRAEFKGDARPETWGAFVLSDDWR